MTADELNVIKLNAHVARNREQRYRDWGVKPSPVVKAGVDHWGSLLGLAIYLGVAALIVFACSVR